MSDISHSIPTLHQDSLRHLLGKPLRAISEEVGPPFASYDCRGRTYFLFNHDTGIFSCVVANGIVTAVNSYTDRRCEMRIKPVHTTRAFIRHAASRLKATLVDVSRTSIAVQADQDASTLPFLGDFVTICTSLKMRPLQITFVTLAGNVIKTDPREKKVVVSLRGSYGTHSYQILTNYLDAQQALLSVGAVFVEELSDEPLEDLVNRQDMVIIKSDLCPLCQEGACGTGHGWHDKKLPAHRGIR